MILGLRLFRGHIFIHLLLKLIEITNELFVIEIETGDEIFIPKMISIDQYPMSFHYYDPIMHIIQEKMSDQRKDHFKFKN